jgi:predicted molibdopterin-dependent oxidoreductase YjgC
VTDKKQRAEKVDTVEMEINHHTVVVPAGANVLRAAELSGISIPSLCFHKDLSPFGGCRMCMVEIEGMRGYPLSCSTIVQKGMKVLTETATLRDMRREVLQLILSEHPVSCLICEEREECRQYQFTIRKSGVSTGCRYCPNDNQCELQRVVEQVGLTEIDYPIYYHGYEAEHNDPFYDRDYNICILCGRCVRMCQEVRGTSVLAFKNRGSKVKIGPAFGDSHVEAGCEFCGACVSVCPTGALADKVSKWDGEPDGMEVSTCPFCCLGCQIELHHKDGKLSKVTGNLDAEINDGQLCLRGRYCLPETTHYHQRAKKPMVMLGEYFREVSWSEAVTKVVTSLKGLGPEDFLMSVSGDLTNEGLYAARKFVRSCLKMEGGIDSTARQNLSGGPALWSWLFSLPISLKEIASADTIIAMGLDSRFYFSVVGVRVRQALKKGAHLVTIDARDSNLARYTEHYLRPIPGREGLLLDFLAKRLTSRTGNIRTVAKEAGVEKNLLKEVSERLRGGNRLAVIIGPTILEYSDNTSLIDGLSRLAKRPRTTFIPLYHSSNIRGALELGLFDELPTGEAPRITLEDVIEGRRRPKVIYLVGQAPFLQRPDCDFLISQDLYLPPFPVDAFLPVASFAESGGTLTNVAGRVQDIVKVENPSDGAVGGFVRPDWWIFSELSRELGCTTLDYTSESEIREEIHRTIPGFPIVADRKPRRLEVAGTRPLERQAAAATGTGDFLLVINRGGFEHRGMELSSMVEGLGELGLEQGLRLNPEDLRRLDVGTGEKVIVSFTGNKLEIKTREDPDCPVGVAYMYKWLNFGGMGSLKGVEFIHALPSNPVRVSIEKR